MSICTGTRAGVSTAGVQALEVTRPRGFLARLLRQEVIRDPRFAQRRWEMVGPMDRPTQVRPFIELARPGREVAAEARRAWGNDR